MTSKNAGKKNDQEIFTSMCRCIESDMYPKQIAEYMSKKTGKKWSKQKVNYWISRLRENHYIRRIVKSSFTKYALSDKGKKFLIHHEKPNYHGHAVEVSYRLINKGNLPEGNVCIKNWSYWNQKFDDFSVRVHYGKENKLIIYPPNIYEDTRTDLLMSLGEKLALIVKFIERSFNCEIDLGSREIVRRLEVHAPKDQMGKLFECEKLNEHGVNIEVNQSGHAHFDINGVEAFERYDRMITEFPKIMDVLGGLTRDMTSTLNFTAKSTDYLRQIRDSLARSHTVRSPRRVIKVIQNNLWRYLKT